MRVILLVLKEIVLLYIKGFIDQHHYRHQRIL